MRSRTPNRRSDFSDRESDGPFPLPADLQRHYRNRIFVDEGHYCQVRDSLELPFEAPGFPRGQMIFETIALSKKALVRQIIDWERTSRFSVRPEQVERLEAPAEIWRCRLYRATLPKGSPDHFNHIEVWDSLAEPCEYRHKLPKGVLLATAQDFSRRRVRRIINLHREAFDVVVAGTWKTPIHI